MRGFFDWAGPQSSDDSSRKARLLAPSEADALLALSKEIVRHAFRKTSTIDPNDPLLSWFGTKTARSVRGLESSIRKRLVGPLAMTKPNVNLNRIASITAAFYVALFAACADLTQRFRSSNPTWLRQPGRGERRAGVPAIDLRDLFMGHDLPLKFHPAAIRASAGFAPVDAVSCSA